jgi:hypothetical protein
MSDDAEGENKRLNKLVATTVVLFTVVLAIDGIKGDNVVQAMNKAKVDWADSWNYYQSIRVKLHLEENSLAMLNMLEGAETIDPTLAKAQRAAYEKDITKYASQSSERRQLAEEHEFAYETYNQRDDQLDFAEAFIEFGVALAAVAALVELYWVLYIAWGSGAIGAYFSLAGFLGLEGRPEWLVLIFGA